MYFICRGDESRVEELTRELADIDDRAKELDKARSQSISSISYINERNRKRNVEQAEKAIMVNHHTHLYYVYFKIMISD